MAEIEIVSDDVVIDSIPFQGGANKERVKSDLASFGKGILTLNGLGVDSDTLPHGRYQYRLFKGGN